MKKLIVNCATCDMCKVSEETLQAYEQVIVNAAMVLVSPKTKELLNRYDVALNVADVLEVPEGENVRVSTHNGAYELTGAGVPLPGECAFLMVNGSLTVEQDALEAAKAYHKIRVNGTATLPKSMTGQLNNLQVNGSVSTYPDGAILLKRNMVIERNFPLRARENALYWAARRLVFTDTSLDAAKLTQKGVRFASREALIAESLAEEVTPLLDEDTDITVVPDGVVFVNDDARMNRRFLKRYGTKVYINGDLIVEEDAAEVLPKMEYLHVNGDVKLPQELADAFEEIDAHYKELRIIKVRGKIIQDQVRVKVDKTLLEKYPEGILITDCAMVKIAQDLTPELIMERLVIEDCAQVFCTEEQESAVSAIARDVAMIGADRDESLGSIGNMVMASLGMDPDVKVINAADYVM